MAHWLLLLWKRIQQIWFFSCFCFRVRSRCRQTDGQYPQCGLL